MFPDFYQSFSSIRQWKHKKEEEKGSLWFQRVSTKNKPTIIQTNSLHHSLPSPCLPAKKPESLSTETTTISDSNQNKPSLLPGLIQESSPLSSSHISPLLSIIKPLTAPSHLCLNQQVLPPHSITSLTHKKKTHEALNPTVSLG